MLPLPLAIALGLALLLVFLCAAWLGYGSGMLVSVVIALAGPRIVVISRVNTTQPEAVRLLLLAVVSLIVSYFGNLHRRREWDLSRTTGTGD